MRTAILLLSLVTSLSALAATFKWVDENGITHYGDSIPPQAVNRGMTEMTKQGQVIRKVDPALTPAQLKAHEAELLKQKELNKQIEERRRRDQALIGTYTAEQEIDLARDRNTQKVDGIIRAAQERISTAQTREKDLAKQMEFYKGKDKSGQPRVPPKDLIEDIERSKSEQTVLNAAIGELQKQKEQISVRFDEDKLRFRQLKQGTAENAAVTPKDLKPERTAVAFTINDSSKALINECLAQWSDRTTNGGKHYAATAELAQIDDKKELVLDGRLQQLRSGQFVARHAVCPLTPEGKVDAKGVEIKKALASLGAQY